MRNVYDTQEDDVLLQARIQNEGIVYAAQPYIVRDNEREAARFNHICAAERKSDEREEDHGGQRDTEQGGRECVLYCCSSGPFGGYRAHLSPSDRPTSDRGRRGGTAQGIAGINGDMTSVHRAGGVAVSCAPGLW